MANQGRLMFVFSWDFQQIAGNKSYEELFLFGAGENNYTIYHQTDNEIRE